LLLSSSCPSWRDGDNVVVASSRRNEATDDGDDDDAPADGSARRPCFFSPAIVVGDLAASSYSTRNPPLLADAAVIVDVVASPSLPAVDSNSIADDVLLNETDGLYLRADQTNKCKASFRKEPNS